MAFEKANLSAFIRVNASKAVSQLNKARASFNSFAKAAQNSAKSVRSVTPASRSAGNSLKTLRTSATKTVSSMTTLGRVVGRAGEGIRTIGTGFSGAGRGLLALSAVAAPAAAAMALALKSTASFTDELGVLGSVTNASSEELESISQTALDIGRNTLQGSAEAVKGLTELSRAGFTPAELAAEGLNVALFDQANNLKDMGLSSRIAVQALRSMRFDDLGVGLSKLTKTANSSATNVKELSQALKFAVPDAKSLGVANDDLLISLGLMANQGLRAGIAGRNLAAMFRNILNPSKRAKDRFGDFTKELVKVDKQGKKTFVSIPKLIEVMGNKLKRFGAIEQGRAIQDAFGVRGARAFRAMSDAITDANGDLEKLQKAIGEIDKETLWNIALSRTKTLTGQLKLLGTGLEALGIAVFKDAVHDVVSSLTDLNEIVRDVGFALRVLTSGISVGDFVELKEAGDRFDKLKPAIRGVAAGINDLREHFIIAGKDIVNRIDQVFGIMGKDSEDTARRITRLVGKIALIAAVFAPVAAAAGILALFLGQMTTAVGGLVSSFRVLLSVVGFVGKLIMGKLSIGLLPLLLTAALLIGVVVLAVKVLGSAFDHLGIGASDVMNSIKTGMMVAWGTIKAVAAPAIDFLMSTLDDLGKTIATEILGPLFGIAPAAQSIGKVVGSVLGGFVAGIAFIISGMVLLVKGSIQLIKDMSMGLVQTWTGIVDTMEQVFKDGFVSGIIVAFREIGAWIMRSIKGPLRTVLLAINEFTDNPIDINKFFKGFDSPLLRGVEERQNARALAMNQGDTVSPATVRKPVSAGGGGREGFLETVKNFFDVKAGTKDPKFFIDFNMKSKTENKNDTNINGKNVASAVSENEQELRDRVGGAPLPWQQTIIRDFGVISIGMDRIS